MDKGLANVSSQQKAVNLGAFDTEKVSEGPFPILTVRPWFLRCGGKPSAAHASSPHCVYQSYTTVEVFVGRKKIRAQRLMERDRSKSGLSHTNALQLTRQTSQWNGWNGSKCPKAKSKRQNDWQHVRSAPPFPSVHIWQFVRIGTSGNGDIPLPCAAWKKQSTGELAALLAAPDPILNQRNQRDAQSKIHQDPPVPHLNTHSYRPTHWPFAMEERW